MQVFPHVIEILTLTYNCVNTAVIKNALVLNFFFIHNTFVYSCHRSCHMYNISSMKENRWSQPSYKY